MKRIRIIMKTLSSMRRVDSVKFGYYASGMKRLMKGTYPWFGLTPTVHQIFDDGSRIIQHHSLPTGMLTEEAREARHRECRRLRLHNTRKNSRENSNFDLLSMLLVSSDPIVGRFYDPLSKQGKTHEKEVEIQLGSNPETSTVRLENLRMSTPSDSGCSAKYDTTDENSHAELTAEECSANSDDQISLILLIPCAPQRHEQIPNTWILRLKKFNEVPFFFFAWMKLRLSRRFFLSTRKRARKEVQMIPIDQANHPKDQI